MRTRVGLDQARAFLADRFAGQTGTVAELGGGDWSRAYSFELGGRPLVARFGAYGEDFEKDRAASMFAGPDLPVPAVLEIGAAFGGCYAISERHFGAFLEALDRPRLQRLMSWRDWLTVTLEDHQGGRVSGWRDRLAELASLDELFVTGEREMRALLPSCPELRHVIHMDLLNRNVLVSEDGSRLEAVFDWACSAYGDFLYDIAWFTFWAPWHPALDAVGFRDVVTRHYRRTALPVPLLDERLRCYELHIGLVHLAYCTFAGRDGELQEVAQRMARLLR